MRELSMYIPLAWRNLFRHRKRTFTTLSAIVVCFCLAVFSIGLGDSGHNSMVKNAINTGDGHLAFLPNTYLENPSNEKTLPGAALLDQLQHYPQLTLAPRISIRSLASTTDNSVGVMLQGINPQSDPMSDFIAKHLIDGEWPGNRTNQVIIGKELARVLKTKLGRKIILMASDASGETISVLGRVGGIYKSGIDQMDRNLIFTSLEFSAAFLSGEQAGQISKLSIFLPDDSTLDSIKQELKPLESVCQCTLYDWREMMPDLVQYIIIDDFGAYIMLTLIMIVVMFGIVNTILMSFLERRREFGLLSALGMNRRQLLVLLFVETSVLFSFAICCSWIVAGIMHGLLAHYGIDFSAIMPEGTQVAGTFMDSYLRPELSVDRVLQLSLALLLAVYLSSIYPMIKILRLTPIEALR